MWCFFGTRELLGFSVSFQLEQKVYHWLPLPMTEFLSKSLVESNGKKTKDVI